MSDQRILITGAGGSIGSALSLRLAALKPARLLLLDWSESRLVALSRIWPQEHVPTAQILGSITDAALLDEIFSLHQPTLVFHAAAYKHVPLLEQHPLAAIENNIFGTKRIVAAAQAFRTRVVLLSTDKAVAPASVMGATKNIAEQIVLDAGESVLRLANVLASRDSVSEIFAHQIATGVPLTVTDPAARRYLLTLDEAADLLLAAAAQPGKARLFSPDLRQSHFIADLARFMASELAPERSPFPIEFSVLRPGDKESEQLWSDEERVMTTACSPSLLSIESPSSSRHQLRGTLAALRSALDDRSIPAAINELRNAVPGYTPSRAVLDLIAQAAPRTAS